MKIENFSIKPHEFRHSIEVQRAIQGATNENIGTDMDWATLFTTRAKILNVRGKEYLEAQGVGVTIEKTFYIRTRRDKLVTNLDRIIYKDQIFNIEYANDVENMGIYTEIKAKMVR